MVGHREGVGTVPQHTMLCHLKNKRRAKEVTRSVMCLPSKNEYLRVSHTTCACTGGDCVLGTPAWSGHRGAGVVKTERSQNSLAPGKVQDPSPKIKMESN